MGVGTAALSGKTAARALALTTTTVAGAGVVEGPVISARTRTMTRRTGPTVVLVGNDAVGVVLGEHLLALLEETAALGGVLGPGFAAAGPLEGGVGGAGGEDDGQQAEGEDEDVAAVEDHGSRGTDDS